MSHVAYELKAELRERVGKGSSRELRRKGLVPAVIYGDKQAPVSIALPVKELTLKIHAGGFMTTIATIDVDGKKISESKATDIKLLEQLDEKEFAKP